MKSRTLFFSFIYFISCSSNKNVNSIREFKSTPMEYSFMTVNTVVDFEVLEYFPTDIYCYTEGGTPYGVFIGKPLKSHLPSRISFLAKCEDRNFKIGQILTATPIEQSRSLPPIKTIISETRGKYKITQLIGAQYPALWCKVEQR